MQARHSKGDSVSRSLPAKQVADPEVDYTGSSSPSAKESTELQDPLIVDPLDSAPPVASAGYPPSPLAVMKTKN